MVCVANSKWISCRETEGVNDVGELSCYGICGSYMNWRGTGWHNAGSLGKPLNWKQVHSG